MKELIDRLNSGFQLWSICNEDFSIEVTDQVINPIANK